MTKQSREWFLDTQQAAESAPSSRHPRILLLDDDPYVLEFLANTLRGMGYSELTMATHASEALLKVQCNPSSAEVIVCDLSMPEMDGIAFLQALNEIPFRGSVILLSVASAREMHSVQRLLSGSGFTILGTLTKPAARDALRGLLETWPPPPRTLIAVPLACHSALDLRAANRGQQWALHYQPQVDLRTGALAGMEALIRWNHPRHGLVSPASFIAAAEKCGAIHAMTEWVVRNALIQQRMWRDAGLSVRMSINISADVLHTAASFARLNALVGQPWVMPTNVTFELTERRLMTPSSVALANLVRLRLQHFSLSIDDFGIGHSSLGQLRDVPFDELKIDRGFVTCARENRIVRPILEGSLEIARRMGMTSVAEGVETEDDWRLVRELGCERAQGYFIGRPMPPEGFWNWLLGWEARRAWLCAA
jgi:EAL domain-containing protein (putative c-di-GMP-specific phosphodiesterase class I)/ActR/RegA family two-component response regulator